MHVTFTPALGEVARLVTTGPFGVDGKTASAQDLVFKATFDSRESYDRAKRDGVRVEMWTDLPVLEQPDWEWAALAFEEPAKAGQVQSGRKVLSLVSPEVHPAIHGEENALYARLSVRLHEYTPGHQFSFTYRLVYPSGEIRWLGEYGHNGVLVVERGVIPAALGVHLNESWNVGSDGKAETQVVGVVEREVGRLSGELNWSTWAIEENRYVAEESFVSCQSSCSHSCDQLACSLSHFRDPAFFRHYLVTSISHSRDRLAATYHPQSHLGSIYPHYFCRSHPVHDQRTSGTSHR